MSTDTVADRESLLLGVGGPISLSVETMRGGRAAGEDPALGIEKAPALGIEEAKDSNSASDPSTLSGSLPGPHTKTLRGRKIIKYDLPKRFDTSEIVTNELI